LFLEVPDDTATASTSLVPVQPVFTDAERLALVGYLAGYRGLTRDAYTLDLRQFAGWCRARSLPLFSVRRADIETFARELEARAVTNGLRPTRLEPFWAFLRLGVRAAGCTQFRLIWRSSPRPLWSGHCPGSAG
jgi:integrase/recombinase XerD